MLLIYFATFLLLLKAQRTLTASGSPIVLVPGDGGSQFEGKLNKTEVVHYWCFKHSDWFSLWLNIELLAPGELGCTVDNLRLLYDYKTHTTRNNDGVQVRVPGFGNSSTVEWLDPSEFSPTSYYYHIAQGIVDKLNYTRNINIRGAPFDFRKAPNELGDYIKNLVALVEDTFKINGDKKVVLLGHSMGNPILLYMLNHQSQKWKDKYIKSFIDMSGPLAGVVKTIRVMASGDNLGVWPLNPLSARPEQRSMPSTAWLLPYSTAWNKTTVLVSTPKKNYTLMDYKDLFHDMNYDLGYQMRLDTEGLGLQELKHPGVEVHCIHGINVKTPASLSYTASQWPDDQPTVTPGNGDGTVNEQSLLACLRWKNGPKPFYHQTFNGAEHLAILKNKDVIDYIIKVLSS